MVHGRKEVRKKCLPLFWVLGVFFFSGLPASVCVLSPCPTPEGLLGRFSPLASPDCSLLYFASRALDMGSNRCMTANPTYRHQELEPVWQATKFGPLRVSGKGDKLCLLPRNIFYIKFTVQTALWYPQTQTRTWSCQAPPLSVELGTCVALAFSGLQRGVGVSRGSGVK